MQPMELILLWVASAWIGGVIGSKRRRLGLGCLMGALLGPIGWIVVVFMPAGARPVPTAAKELSPPSKPGSFRTQVVGESHYQDTLENLCGPRTEDGVDCEMTAFVTCDNKNKYDDQAVVVTIDGETVGYLSRHDARRFRERYGEREIECLARIRGGWEREDEDTGSFGVTLALPL